ncbi:conserved hypothetical protein [Vibrio phage 137E35-1]|nr:conserved hypothetical protein [Vibrio phage 137E35-1]CAH9015891.1 conserved hypothetical protein [Vibrio phage 230E39-1]
MSKEITPEQASKQLYNLLAEKAGIEKQVDRISSTKELMSFADIDKSKSEICFMTGTGNERSFGIESEMVSIAMDAMLEKHAARLDEINDTLLFMVKLIK